MKAEILNKSLEKAPEERSRYFESINFRLGRLFVRCLCICVGISAINNAALLKNYVRRL